MQRQDISPNEAKDGDLTVVCSKLRNTARHKIGSAARFLFVCAMQKSHGIAVLRSTFTFTCSSKARRQSSQVR